MIAAILERGPLTRKEVSALTPEKRTEYLLSLVTYVENHGLSALADRVVDKSA
jgi:hypothetical protein